jgi:hypothetical protein
MLCTLHGDASVITGKEMVFKVLDDEKKRKGAKGMGNPSEIPHERDAKKGKVDKKGQDENTTPPGKLSTFKQDGLNKKFNEDRSSRK